MSKREWKPGDVAMVVRQDGTESRAIMSRWTSHWQAFESGASIVDARPLVVIDPEDREQVERLADILMRRPGNQGDWSTLLSPSPEMLAQALRSLIEPPKPEEPTGLGAVVVTGDGKRYVRTADQDCTKPWSYANNYSDCEWSEIPAVRVLSEGVQ